MVILYPIQTVNKIRQLEPFEGLFYGEYVRPERVCITPKINAHCRCCGYPLDVGVRAIAAKAYGGWENPHKSSKIKPARIYVHEDNCLEEGFVNTFGFRGRSPDHFVVVVDGKPREGKIKRDTTRLIHKGGGTSFLGLEIEYLDIRSQTFERIYG